MLICGKITLRDPHEDRSEEESSWSSLDLIKSIEEHNEAVEDGNQLEVPKCPKSKMSRRVIGVAKRCICRSKLKKYLYKKSFRSIRASVQRSDFDSEISSIIAQMNQDMPLLDLADGHWASSKAIVQCFYNAQKPKPKKKSKKVQTGKKTTEKMNPSVYASNRQETRPKSNAGRADAERKKGRNIQKRLDRDAEMTRDSTLTRQKSSTGNRSFPPRKVRKDRHEDIEAEAPRLEKRPKGKKLRTKAVSASESSFCSSRDGDIEWERGRNIREREHKNWVVIPREAFDSSGDSDSSSEDSLPRPGPSKRAKADPGWKSTTKRRSIAKKPKIATSSRDVRQKNTEDFSGDSESDSRTQSRAAARTHKRSSMDLVDEYSDDEKIHKVPATKRRRTQRL